MLQRTVSKTCHHIRQSGKFKSVRGKDLGTIFAVCEEYFTLWVEWMQCAEKVTDGFTFAKHIIYRPSVAVMQRMTIFMREDLKSAL